jgi:hypothetical protein
MSSLILVLVALLHPAAADSARLIGSTMVVEPIGLQIALPPVWFGAKDTVKGIQGCGHDLHGSAERRFATSQAMLDSLRNAGGEWDREYSAVSDTILPFSRLVAQVGPEPFGDGQCFGDLQMRIYVFPDASAPPKEVKAAGLRTARSFFPSATLVDRDSAQWHIDRLRWDAWYYDYGAEANVEIFTTTVRGRTVALVFMRAGGDIAVGGPISGSVPLENDAAARDERFILEHIRFH